MGTVRRVTNAQLKELRLWLRQGASLKMAAMKSGMDRKSARKYREQERLPSEARGPRNWRTREDPLARIWPQLEEMLGREPSLQAVSLLGWLQSVYPGVYPDSVRRTLERRVRRWKAEHGPDKEVFFAQVHEPGRLGASDFTHMSSLDVTIAGQAFDHLVYHFVLTHSNWEHVTVCFSESFASLSEGLQNALWALGGVPQRHRTDRMTLAVHADGQAEQFTARYTALLAHYGLAGEATNPASGHENGDCEQSHRRFKEAVEQAMMLRGSRDFASRADYETFLRELVRQRNRQRACALAAEALALHALPARRLETQERRRVRVRRGSTIQVGNNTYSVPARLIGEYVEVRLGVEEIEVWYAQSLVQQMPRLRGQNKRHIDYRHIVGWLVRKPGAFARYAFREELYPTLAFRRAYDRLQAQDAERADKDYVQLLYLAAQEGESAVAAALEQVLGTAQALRLGAVRALLGQPITAEVAAQVTVPAVDLGQYDALLTAAAALTAEQRPASGTVPEEVKHGRARGSEAVFDGTALADDACPIRRGGAASDGGDVGLCRLPAGTRSARVPAASGEPDRASAQGVEVALGEELAGVGPEAVADEGRATVARPVERRLPGPTGECAGVRATGIGEDPLCGGSGPGVGAGRAARVVHDVRLVGSRPVGGQAGLHAQRPAQTPGPLGSVDPGRPGLCAAEPGRNGSVVHVVGGALRAWQRAADEQPGVLEVGANLQGSDDDGGGSGSVSAPQRDRGVEHPELSGRSCQTSQAPGRVAGSVGVSVGGSGSAPVALAARGLPTLRQTPQPQDYARLQWGKIIVAKGER
jgi:hypothetical protein